MIEKKIIPIRFLSKQDFMNRICALWQDQKDDEVYEFEFSDDATKEAYEDLIHRFKNDNYWG